MKRISLVVLYVLLFAPGLLAQSRAKRPNDFTLELGGKSWIYSLSYQRMIGETVGLEVGVSYIGGLSDGDHAVSYLSGGTRLYLMKKNATPCFAAGAVLVSSGTDAVPFDDTARSHVYFYAAPGFEYRSSGGFLLRVSLNALIGDFVYILPGLALGIAF